MITMLPVGWDHQVSLSDEATDAEVILRDLLRSLDRIISVNSILLDITFIELDRSVGW